MPGVRLDLVTAGCDLMGCRREVKFCSFVGENSLPVVHRPPH